jgi:hypothetical protein
MASRKQLARMATDMSRSPEERAAARAALGEGTSAPTPAPIPAPASRDEDHPLYAKFVAQMDQERKFFGEPPEAMKINFREWLSRREWAKRWMSEHDVAELPYPSTQEWWQFQGDFEKFLASPVYLALKAKPTAAAPATT